VYKGAGNQPTILTPGATRMQLKLIRHLWGLDEPWETLFPKIKAAGYTGIETAPPPPADRARFRDLLDAHGFAFVAGTFTRGATVQEHLDSLERQLEDAAALKPLLIGCHGGRDAWPLSQCEQFFEGALAAEAAVGIPVGHETHRGRPLYNPWATRDLLKEFPDLKVCCDFSHWVVVAERLVDDDLDIIAQAAQHAIHIHARVGYEEGPQVPDPRAPEYHRHLEAHERWWDLVWDAQEARGMEVSTLTPEFGPPMYLHTLPFTNVPVADLWDVCNWQAARQAARFAGR
jgi:sugar phosphate isomerase/epimerase